MLASRVKPIKKRWAKAMRRKPTKTEALLLKELRKAAAGRYTVFSQRIVLGYILDIYLPGPKVAVEIDGSSHDGRERYDESRDAQLRQRAGILTLRFSAENVEADAAGVVTKILRFCQGISR